MTPKKIVLLCGFDKSGKSTSSKFFFDSGFQIFECGAVVKSLIDSKNKIEISQFYESNMYELNKLIYEKICSKYEENTSLLIIGVRSTELLNLIKNKFNNLIIIFINSDLDQRYKRYLSHNKINSLLSFFDFKENDAIQIRWGLNKIKLQSNYLIDNKLDLQSFQQIIESILGTINEKAKVRN
jgi:dephospho-CoA kinase